MTRKHNYGDGCVETTTKRRNTSRVGTSFPSAPAARAVTARLWRMARYIFPELKMQQSSTSFMNVASWEQSKWSVRRRAGKWTAWTDWFAQAVQGALMRQTGQHARLLSYADTPCARKLLVWPRLARQHHFQLCAPVESRRHRGHAMVRWRVEDWVLRLWDLTVLPICGLW